MFDVSKSESSFNFEQMQQETVSTHDTNTLVVSQTKKTYSVPSRSKKHLRNKKTDVAHTVKQSNKHNQARYLSSVIKAMIN